MAGPALLESKMSAVAEVPLTPPASPNWLQRLSALDRAQRMRLGVGVALLVAAAIAAGLAYLVHRAVELPTQDLGKRVMKRAAASDFLPAFTK